MIQINSKVIGEIADRSATAEAFFTYAACRDRNSRNGVSDIKAIRAQMEKEGFTTVPQDLLVMFRELDKVGIGRLQGNQFKWSVPIKSVGQALAEPTKPKVERSAVTPPSNPKNLVFLFEGGKEISVTYTESLSKEDLQLLWNRLLKEVG